MVLSSDPLKPAVSMAWIGQPDDAHHGILRVSLPDTPAAAGATQRQSRHGAFLNVILDNSMSMGSHSRAGIDALVRPLAASGLFHRGAITLFDDGARSYAADTAADVDALLHDLPRQGMTDILGGVQRGMAAAANRIRSVIRDGGVGDTAGAFSKGGDVHIVTVMLTDGGHNTGPRPEPASLEAARRKLAADLGAAGAGSVQHTVVMFCLTESSDATVSMAVKAAFETAEVPGLPSVFFAATHGAMTAALGGVIEGLTAALGTAGARFVSVGLRGARVMATDAAVSTVHLRPGGSVELLVEVTDRDAFGVKLGPEETAPGEHAVASVAAALEAVRGAAGPLARASVAGGSEAQLAARIDAIAGVIDVCERLQARTVAAAAAAAAGTNNSNGRGGSGGGGELERLTPAERRALVRAARTATTDFQTARNELFALKVKGRSNSDKLQLLTGRQGKFAAVAAGRSKAEGRTAAEVYANTASVRATVAKLLREDAAALAAHGVAEDALPVSAVSLLSQRECLEQWASSVDGDVEAVLEHDPRDHDDDAIFDVLCALGVLGVPVRYAGGDCVQVDPMQLKVTALGCEVVDTAAMTVSLKLNRPVKLGDGREYVDALPLIDPAFPRATSFVLRRSMWAEHLTSAAVSRDLYLYLPSMQLAAHTHALRKAVSDAVSLGVGAPSSSSSSSSSAALRVSEAHVRLALRVLYSASRHVVRPHKSTEVERGLLGRWLGGAATLTRSEGDKVDHPAVLQLYLAIFGWDRTADINGAKKGEAERLVPAWSDVDERTALLNLLNEVLARRVGGGIAAAQRLLGITAGNSPAAQADPFEEEPAHEAVLRRCGKAPPAGFGGASAATQRALADLAGAAGVDAAEGVSTASVVAFVESVWAPYVAVHRFTTALLAAAASSATAATTSDGDDDAEKPSMLAVLDGFERTGGVPEPLVRAVCAELKRGHAQEPSVWATLCVDPQRVEAAAVGALVQALVFGTSRVRSEGNVVASDVTDGATQRQLIEALHMAHYQESLARKQQQFVAMVGDVVAAQARTCDVATLRTMIGVHTHGHCRNKFWGFVEGVVMDPNESRREAKLAAIRETSNRDVARAISRATAAAARGGGGSRGRR